MQDIIKGRKAIYLTGVITYDTVFQKDRTTAFRFYVGGDMDLDSAGEMSADDIGNDAT